jgi:hypothetical protein
MALMTLITDDDHLCAWPCGKSPVSKEQAQAALDEANANFSEIGMDPPYVKGVVPEIDREDEAWDGAVYPLSPLERLAGQAE